MTSSRLRNGNCQIARAGVRARCRQELVAFMHRIVAVAHRSFAEELRLSVVRVPARAPDPASHHVIAPRHEIRVMRRRGREDRQNFVASFRGAALVQIEAENPLMAALRNRLIAQVTEATERDLHDPRPKALGDLVGAIATAGIGDHDLVRPQHARDRVCDLLGFIISEDIGRYILHVFSLLSLIAAHAITATRHGESKSGGWDVGRSDLSHRDHIQSH